MGWAQLIFFWLNQNRENLRYIGANRSRNERETGRIAGKTLPPMGYELVDWEMSRGRMVRVFIDKPRVVLKGSMSTIARA